ncbi:hypothetical protein FEDK69T_23270 [Flavobacterium enshiense DK69]|uniref:T9SS type A sorting domain-containing protein n=1 Tax=Flavobacterium enshiense TaxID=1341165 RepID=UPI0003C63082|nr:DUF4832 domain-containing protein [Flavobacterium enshiense]ESU22343.1 hypothetical protein FEDK69T_23270 [Flavobacterium enshiense DK69]
MRNTTIFKRYFKGVVLALLHLPFVGIAQTTATVNYTSSLAVIANPERGFYKHTEVHSPSYTGLSESTLNGYRANNITLILRVFYLENFVNGPISDSYLSNMQADFNKIRNAGLKCIIRFAYSDEKVGVLDAPKAIVLQHISQLKNVLTSNEDVICAMQAGFIGSWGEWYYTDHFGMPPSSADYANRREVVDAILASLPSTKMVQIRTPKLKQRVYNTSTPLSQDQAYNGTTLARVGHHNDCFLASASDYGTYENTSTEYPYLEQETKYLAMGGETCAVYEPRTKCPTALAEMEKFHWAYLNIDYNRSVLSGFQSGGCFPDVEKRLGYRYELVSGTYPQTARANAPMTIAFRVKNSGFSSLYNSRTVFLVLRNTSNSQEYRIPLNTDPRFWSSKTEQVINEAVVLPSNMVAGNYKMYLYLPDKKGSLALRPEYSVRLSNESIWENTTGYNNLLHTVGVQSSLGTYGNVASNIKLYPVPANDKLIVELEGINQYEVSMYNSLGQKMNIRYSSVTNNMLVMDTQDFNTGVYFIQFQNEGKREVRCITVNR